MKSSSLFLVILGLMWSAALVLAGEAANREPAPAAESNAAPSAELMAIGQALYHLHCSQCHGISGNGSQGVSFRNNPNLADSGYIINQVLNGGRFMPPLGRALDDDAVAAVLTFVRNSWGNDYGSLDSADVTPLR